jgi:hypothetical protein
MDHRTIDWLLEGDVSIQYQVHRDLLDREKPKLRARIETEGWGARFLSFRMPDGHWGQRFYQPKWTSTHYTLLDLKNLGISPGCKTIRQTLDLIVKNEKGPDGGLKPIGTLKVSDVCINGMALNYLAYFKTKEDQLRSIVDFLLSQHMDDGGFNCYSNRSGAVHSSLHTTLSVLEGILEYTNNNYQYRLDELSMAAAQCHEFILQHRLYRSDKTGIIIDKKMLALSYPSRWRYDILRALDYFQFVGHAYDPRMDDAIEVLLNKRTKDSRWKLQAAHHGQTHFDMEKVGQPSRWNTLRTLRVLKHFNIPADVDRTNKNHLQH